MTSATAYDLKVEMRDSTGQYKRVNYTTFSVGPGGSYALSIDGFLAEEFNFVRDALAPGNGRGFSTTDLDMDGDASSSCALDWGQTAGWSVT